MSKLPKVIQALLAFLATAALLWWLAGRFPNQAGNLNPNLLHLVATEGFYGNIAKQIGGSKVQVISILSNPAVDPHSYEPTTEDSLTVASADIVIENGLNYDGWINRLLAASPNKNRTVIIASQVAGDILPDNPHLWYDLNNIDNLATDLAQVLAKKDPSNSSFYAKQLAVFKQSLKADQQKQTAIARQFGGSAVGSTESIFDYQAPGLGLSIITPPDFQLAVAQGNDPSASDVALVEKQISNKEIKVLLYNRQTVTPLTTSLQNLARSAGVPVVDITETMPEGQTYQSWMSDQMTDLSQALKKSERNK